MNNTKLKKGSFYAAFKDGRLNYGTYVGKTPTHFAFRVSTFATDHGMLDSGIVFGELHNWFFVEIPESESEKEARALKYVMSCLPE